MNQQKIGGFIAKARKAKGLTQAQLAEMLGVTDKAVSKWENGICLPDASKYEPLCDLLDISINELFAGEKISESEYKAAADRNLLELLEHRLYDGSSQEISFEAFKNALSRISEVSVCLSCFETKAAAIEFLMRESGICEEECSKAYDLYMKMFNLI